MFLVVSLEQRTSYLSKMKMWRLCRMHPMEIPTLTRTPNRKISSANNPQGSLPVGNPGVGAPPMSAVVSSQVLSNALEMSILVACIPFIAQVFASPHPTCQSTDLLSSTFTSITLLATMCSIVVTGFLNPSLHAERMLQCCSLTWKVRFTYFNLSK